MLLSFYGGLRSAQPGAASPGCGRECRLRLAAVVALALGSFGVGHAMDDPATLQTIVVTATRSEKTLADTPIRTEVVGRQEIARTHARTLTQALQDVPGLQLREVHGKAGFEVTMQGLTSDQVLILVDGLPLTPSTGSTVDLSQLLLAEVERIEIVKGATSAQYGSSAMGGVVNVITRGIRPGLSGSIATDIGTRGAQNPRGGSLHPAVMHGQARLEGGDVHWRWRLHADAVDDDGYTLDREAWARPGDAVRRMQGGGRLEWLPARHARVWLDANLYAEQARQRYDFLAPPRRVPQGRIEDIERQRLTFGGQWRMADTRLAIKGLHERYDSTSDFLSDGVPQRTRVASQRSSHLGLQVDLPAWHRQLWQFGADLRREQLAQRQNGVSELDGDRARTSRELFVQNDILFDDTWELLLGMRWQHDSDFGAHLAPKASLRAHLPAIGAWTGALRLSVGQGYRVPNLKERHFLFDHSALGYVVIGNPDLRPESSDSFQLGLSAERGRTLSWDLHYFHNRVEDLIQIDEANAVTVNQITTYTYRNVARARTQGIEAGVRWQAGPGLDLRAAYTLTHARDLATGQDLTRRPRHQWRAGLDWQWRPDLALAVRARAQSSERVSSDSGARSPAWATLDLKLNWQLSRATAVFAGIDNVFGRQRDFANPSDFGPLAGRFVYLGLRHDFGLHP